VNTQVEMRFGETLVLGGLILQRETETRTKLPFLGDIPVLGSVFSRRNSDVGETEVMIMVTPQMVAPITPGQLPITGPGTNTEPTASHEFYFDGFVEVPRYNPIVDPIGSPGHIDLVTPYDCPPPGMTAPPLPPADQIAPPAIPAEHSLGKGSSSDSRIQQASGTRTSATERRSTTLGTMDPSRFAVEKKTTPAKAAASVKSNAGDDLRASGASAGHSTGRKPPKPEMIEPAATQSSRADGFSTR
jgi:pilus assembly protein CpaC